MLEETLQTEINNQAETAPPVAETAPVETTPQEPVITLGEDGELNVPDDFFGDIGGDFGFEAEVPRVAAEPKPEPEPSYYSLAEFARAFADGTVDESKLKPELAEYYKAAAENAPRQQQAQAPPQIQQQPLQMTRDHYAQLLAVSREVAARNYLGIEPDAFDPYDQTHIQAQNFAMNEIREQATALHRMRMEESFRQQQEAILQQQRTQMLNGIYSEFAAKEPELKQISDYFDEWMEGLTGREIKGVMEVMRTGDPGRIRALIERLAKDYKAAKGTGAAEKKSTPPPVVQAGAGEVFGGTGGSSPADLSKLSEMTPEQQAEFLIKNKYLA